MAQVTNEFISAILQVVAFALFPFIFFVFRKDKSWTFFKYLGLYKPTAKSTVYAVVISLFFVITGVGLAFINEGVKQAVLSPNSVTGKMSLMGINTTSVIILLITALIKTSLSEEIFFRGFLAKQLIYKFGFTVGNMVQAIIFGLVHLILFWLLTNTASIPLIIIFIFSSLGGFIIGYINEKNANGSIVPGWIAHGLGNTYHTT